MSAAKLGMGGIIFGVLLLVVGLVLSDVIINNVNRQGAKIGCYDGEDRVLSGAKGPTKGTGTTSSTVPSKVSKNYPGPSVINAVCGTGVTAQTAGADVNSFGTATCTDSATQTCGTIRYDLEVYGADSLNNLFTLIYWIVLVSISLAMIGGGGYAVARAGRGGMM